MKVLITGGSGFLGKRLVERFTDGGCEVDAPDSHECCLCDDGDNFRVRLGKISWAPDIVVHAAADCGGIGFNRRNGAILFSSNMTMGTSVVDGCLGAGWRPKLVNVGTCCSYPRDCPIPMREDDLWNGYPEKTNAMYGIAKRALVAYATEASPDNVSLILANLYGPGDNFDPESSHVIPAIIRKIDEAQKAGADRVKLWGTGMPTREFLYVDDAAEAIYQAATRKVGEQVINIGTGKSIKIHGLATKIAALMGFSGLIVWNTSMPDGQPKRQLQVSRARKHLGWTATVDLDTGLKRTIEWYRAQQVQEVQNEPDIEEKTEVRPTEPVPE